MNKMVLLVVASMLGLNMAYAQQDVHDAYFEGYVHSDQDTIRLEAVLIRKFLINFGSNVAEEIKIPVGKSGRFRLKLSGLTRTSRVAFLDAFSNNTMFSADNGDNAFVMVEPGDHVKMRADISSGKGQFRAVFSGTGSAKYECWQRIQEVPSPDGLRQWNEPVGLKRKEDSAMALREEILGLYKEKMSDSAYAVMEADVRAEVYNYFLVAKADGVLYSRQNVPDNVLRELSIIRNSLFPGGNALGEGWTILYSPAATSYLYEREKLNYVVETGGRGMELGPLYKRIRKDFQGLAREKLLAYCLVNPIDLAEYFRNVTTEEYTDCVNDADTLIRTGWLAAEVRALKHARSKGAQVYNFCLPTDSTTKMTRLSDFRGKVVLLDMWSYRCTACYMFSKAFHDKVYPLFKDNRDFKVISVMLSETPKDLYMHRLRNEAGFGGVTYTFPDYVNLFAGYGADREREAMVRDYMVNAAPCIYLIDKKGDVFSSTVPFFTDDHSPNIEKLTSLIERALNE